MTDFITRVELHGASSAEYEKLHAAMAAQGFSQRVISRDNVAFGLPTAMYLFRANALAIITAENIRDMARRAADSTGRNSWIFTSEMKDAAWYLNTVP